MTTQCQFKRRECEISRGGNEGAQRPGDAAADKRDESCPAQRPLTASNWIIPVRRRTPEDGSNGTASVSLTTSPSSEAGNGADHEQEHLSDRR